MGDPIFSRATRKSLDSKVIEMLQALLLEWECHGSLLNSVLLDFMKF